MRPHRYQATRFAAGPADQPECRVCELPKANGVHDTPTTAPVLDAQSRAAGEHREDQD